MATSFGAVTVLGRHGPHTTPVAVTRSGRRHWFTTSRRAVKVDAIRRTERASLLVTVDGVANIVDG